MSLHRVLFVAGCLCAILLQGCGNSSSNNANVRVINLISGATGVNVTAGGTSILSGAGFEAIGAYVGIGQGNQEFKVTVNGSPGTLVDVIYTLSSGIDYTLVTFGTPGASSGVLIADAFGTPGTGNFAVRVLNTSLVAGPVDLYLTAPGADISAATPVLTAVAPGVVSAFTNVAAGNLEVRVTPTGNKNVIYDAAPTTYAQGTGQTIVTYSKGSGALVNAAILASGTIGAIVNSQIARFKVANGTAVASPLNIFVDGNPAISNLAYAAVADYLVVAAGTRTITVEASATPGAALLTTKPTFAPATDNSMALSGAAGAVAALTLVDSNPFIALGRAQVRVVNVSPDFAAVDVYANFGKLATGLAANAASANALVDATLAGTTYQFDFNAAGTTNVVLSLPGQLLAGTHDYTVYLVGSGSTLKAVLTQDR